MHAVWLAARVRADLVLLVGALAVDRGAMGSACRLALAELEHVEPAGNLLPDARLVIERVARLVDVAKLDRVANLDRALVGLFLAGDHAEQRCLAGAVRPDHPDDAAGRQLEGEIVDQQIVTESFAEAVEVDHVLAQPLSHRNDDLGGLGRLLAGLLEEVLVALIARLRFCLPRLRTMSDPFLLARERPLPRLFLAPLLLEPLLLLHQPGRIIALVRDPVSAI